MNLRCNRIFALICFVASALPLQIKAQPTTLPIVKIVQGSYENFEVDPLGNLYVLNNSQQLKKLSPNFDSVVVYNDVKRFGTLYAIDVSNPLKVLLFYKDFSIIVTLDRLLSIRNVLDLRQHDILQASAITQSFDNQIWLYDAFDNKIKKMDESGKLLAESPDFRVIFNPPPQPTKLEDYNQLLFAYDSTVGLMILDYYGAIRNTVALKELKNIHGMGKGIVATNAEGLVYYIAGTIDFQTQKLPPLIIHSKKIRLYKGMLYVLGWDAALTIYQLPEPTNILNAE